MSVDWGARSRAERDACDNNLAAVSESAAPTPLARQERPSRQWSRGRHSLAPSRPRLPDMLIRML